MENSRGIKTRKNVKSGVFLLLLVIQFIPLYSIPSSVASQSCTAAPNPPQIEFSPVLPEDFEQAGILGNVMIDPMSNGVNDATQLFYSEALYDPSIDKWSEWDDPKVIDTTDQGLPTVDDNVFPVTGASRKAFEAWTKNACGSSAIVEYPADKHGISILPPVRPVISPSTSSKSIYKVVLGRAGIFINENFSITPGTEQIQATNLTPQMCELGQSIGLVYGVQQGVCHIKLTTLAHDNMFEAKPVDFSILVQALICVRSGKSILVTKAAPKGHTTQCPKGYSAKN